VVLEAGRNFEVLEVTTLELEFGDFVDVLGRETLLSLGNESTLRVGKGEDDTSKFDNLECGVLSNVSGSRDEGLLSFEVLSRGSLDHLLEVVDTVLWEHSSE